MTERIGKYDLHLNTRDLGTIKVATVALREEWGALDEFALRYTAEYLENENAFPLDPIQLPLSRNDIFLHCRAGGVPGILDDYLPDDWGRNVLAQVEFYRTGKRLHPKSVIDTLALLNGNRIGALQWTAQGEKPDYSFGAAISDIAAAEHAAQHIDSERYQSQDLNENTFVYLAHSGTGVGGARPKALVHDEHGVYLAKFNSLTRDRYNNAKVELAVLKMAKEASIHVFDGKVIEGINEREVLLLERFDLDGKARKHLITVNSLLKFPENQCDREGTFRYDDIADLIRKYSFQPEQDLEQLLLRMLFNAAINNTDDHERNFSFISSEKGLSFSPAYDMVPSLAVGEYHVAGYQFNPQPPRPSELGVRKVFGLSKPTVKRCIDTVSAAIAKWPDFANNENLNESDFLNVSRVIRV